MDVIIIGRGGGSAEDLWAFNNERLAYAVAESAIPVISAVGHESDFTICDFVADKRAPTPSAAAELAVPDMTDIKSALDGVKGRMSNLLLGRVNNYRKNLKYLSETGALSDSSYIVNDRRMTLFHLSEKLDIITEKRVDKARASLSGVAAKLDALSPLAVVARGYSVVTDTEGNALKSVQSAKVGANIDIRMSDGSISATVKSIKKGNKNGNKE